MNSNYNNSGFHVKGPSAVVEPMLGPLNESSLQGLSFVSNRDQYGFHTHSHGDSLRMGILPQHQIHSQGPFNHQPTNHDQHSLVYKDSSCLHGERRVAFNSSGTAHPHVLDTGFGQQMAEAQTRECVSHQRMLGMPEFQPHGHPNENHAVPAPCLPLDQSPHRATSFHGLPSSSPENHRLEHYRLFPQSRMSGSEHCFPCDPLTGTFDMTGFSTEPKLSYCDTNNQVFGGQFSNFHTNRSRGPVMCGSKVEQQLPQQNMSSERLGNRVKMDPGISIRQHLVSGQRPGPVSRQNPASPSVSRFYPTADYVANSTDLLGGNVVHLQHGHLDRPIHRLNNHSIHPFSEPMFDIPQFAPQPSHHPHLSPLPYLKMAKRPRFDGAGNCSLHNQPNPENCLSPPAFPSPIGEFTSQVTDGFQSSTIPLGASPHQQQQQQQRQNAAMIIKQMASRSQQQRVRQSDQQQLSLPGDVTPNGAVCRGPLSSALQFGFEKKPNFHGNYESHPPQESSWFPEPQPCRETSSHGPERVENGHNIIFRQGPTSLDMQSSSSPGTHHSFEGNVNPLQIQSPNDSNLQSIVPADQRPAEYGGMTVRRQHSFPPGGQSLQTALQNSPQGFSSSPGNFPAHPEFLSSQHLSVSKLSALSLGNLNKASTKDTVFGQSCLAALSTACQNMIASLGAPNLNVTFNKKSQNEAKRKAGQVEQDINSSGACGPMLEYFQSNASHCSGNNSNAIAGQSGAAQMVKREESGLSPSNSTESGCEGKMSAANSKGRGKKRRDSGHLSPRNFSPLCSSNPVVSPSQQASSISTGSEGRGKTPEGSLVSPSFGKPELATSMDSGIQSVGKSDGVSPCMDYLDEASPNFSCEDSRPCRNTSKCTSDHRAVYGDTVCADRARTPLSNTTQDEVHPLEILQAQIQLQRQQFSISEDQPLGGKAGKKPECQATLKPQCSLVDSSPAASKDSVNSIDLDSLMTDQHDTWFVPGSESSRDKCLGFWDRARGQSDNKEGLG